MTLISDETLLTIPIKDTGEKLVNAKTYCPSIIFSLGKYIKNDGKGALLKAKLVRDTVAKKLSIAQSFLPKGFKLVVRCGYRQLSLQKKRYDQFYTKVKRKHPSWSEKQIRTETSKMVAPPDIVPPHSTGGAVDLSVIDSSGKKLNMGTKLGQFNNKTITNSKYLSRKEKSNREVLSKVMTKAGFVNYPTEWWHWSYGDRYWAAVKKQKYSIYKGL